MTTHETIFKVLQRRKKDLEFAENADFPLEEIDVAEDRFLEAAKVYAIYNQS